MHLVLGLGNPGPKYELTRHNIGFELVDALGDPGAWKSEHRALTQRVVRRGQPLLLAKPQTYMNLSGESARALLHYYKLPVSALIVAVDDVNLELGAVRIRLQGSAGGHNGLKSLIQHCGEEFARVRVGVGPCPAGGDLSHFVLRKYAPEERRAMAGLGAYFGELIDAALSEGWDKAATRFNRKSAPAP